MNFSHLSTYIEIYFMFAERIPNYQFNNCFCGTIATILIAIRRDAPLYIDIFSIKRCLFTIERAAFVYLFLGEKAHVKLERKIAISSKGSTVETGNSPLDYSFEHLFLVKYDCRSVLFALWNYFNQSHFEQQQQFHLCICSRTKRIKFTEKVKRISWEIKHVNWMAFVWKNGKFAMLHIICIQFMIIQRENHYYLFAINQRMEFLEIISTDTRHAAYLAEFQLVHCTPEFLPLTESRRRPISEPNPNRKWLGSVRRRNGH